MVKEDSETPKKWESGVGLSAKRSGQCLIVNVLIVRKYSLIMRSYFIHLAL